MVVAGVELECPGGVGGWAEDVQDLGRCLCIRDRSRAS